jgi:isopenicillin-N N-acyltransferase-like protein
MTTDVRIPLIELSGDARERGRQHGEAARDRIRLSIDVYAEAFGGAAGLSWDEVRELAPRWLPLVEAYNGPELVDELHGIAEGADVTLGDVLALNGRGDLSYTNPFADEECSAWALLDEATPDGHTYCGQNWDWRLATQETVVMLRIEQPGKPTIVMQTEAGQIGRQGANSAGLALNATGLGPRWGSGLRLPQPYIRRRILDSWDFQEALEAIFHSQQSVCSNLLLTHRDGFAIDIETTPGRHAWGYPEDGVLVHTNHFVYFVPPQIEATYRPAVVDSLIRLERIEGSLRRVRDTRDGEELRALVRETMSDHFSFPNSVCNHPDERDAPVDRSQTVASTIVDLTTGEYRLSHGPPCANEYELLPWNLYAEAPAPAAVA